MTKRILLRAVVFLVILAVALAVISDIVVFRGNVEAYHWIHGFYEERKDSLDAVLFGASSVYTAWAAPMAWGNYGIAVYPFCSAGQPFEATEYLIKEARKTQPDALYIVNINLLWSEISESAFHDMIDYMPYSRNKLDMIRDLAALGGYTGPDSMEFYMPLLRFHSNWKSLKSVDFSHPDNEVKAARTTSGFYTSVEDVSDRYLITTKRTELTDRIQTALDDLLDYCDEESVNVLFLTTPQMGPSEVYLAMYNTINDMVSERGYPFLNLRDRVDEIGLDLAKDYYNPNHTNAHGTLKLTDYLARYLVENYGFHDKRGDASYSDWDEAYETYLKISATGFLDFEYTNEKWDTSLTTPELTKLSVSGTTLTLSWKAVSGADGYRVYRKEDDGGWKAAATLGADTLTYRDEDCRLAHRYTYTVAPFQNRDDGIYWGSYDFKGISATALMNAPGAPELSGGENGLTLSWTAVKSADGYLVSRRVFGKSWITLGEVTGTSYTDDQMLEGMPYQYRVRAYWDNEAGDHVYGSWSGDTLYLPEISAPEVTAELADGVPVLSWDKYEVVTNFTVTRRTAGGGWEQIAEALANSTVQFRDITAEAGVKYEYQVTANLVYGKETYTYPSAPVQITAEAGPTALDPPEILFCEQVDNTVQLVWEPSANATAYRIYRMAEGEDEWTVIRPSQSGVNYQDRPPAAGLYVYAVQALRSENGCTYYGAFTKDSGLAVEYEDP